MANKLQFSVKDNNPINEQQSDLVKSCIMLTQMAMDRYHSSNILKRTYSIQGESYKELEEATRKSVLKYCAEKANIDDTVDLSTKEGILHAFDNDTFRWHFFAIQTQALQAVNADNEVEDILVAANIDTVGIGDSATYEIASKALYHVQDNSYGNLTSYYQEQFITPVTITPRPKIASVDFDVIQLVGLNYDFGREMAKVAMSFRTRMYIDVVEELYTIANLSGTPLSPNTFAKLTYVKLGERVRAANGNIGVRAYGTRAAFTSMSDTVDSGFSTQDQINETGFIGNLYGIPSTIFNQAVDSTTANLTFQVPDDRVILLSAATDKPIKLVREGSVFITENDGRNKSLYRRSYTYTDSWTAGLATQASYAIQPVA